MGGELFFGEDARVREGSQAFDLRDHIFFWGRRRWWRCILLRWWRILPLRIGCALLISLIILLLLLIILLRIFLVLVVVDCAGSAGHDGCADCSCSNPSAPHFSSFSRHFNLLIFCLGLVSQSQAIVLSNVIVDRIVSIQNTLSFVKRLSTRNSN